MPLPSRTSMDSSMSDVVNSTTTPGAADAPPSPTTITQRSNSGVHLNPRSCVTCRRRKVRCNKEEPCSNCVKQGIDCVFPAAGRAPRKARRPPDTELLKRLRRLEGVVQSLGANVDDAGSVTHLASPSSSTKSPTSQPLPSHRAELAELSNGRGSPDHQIGRLVINEGRSRYISNAFWISLGNEIAEMRDILDGASSEDDADDLSPDLPSGTGPVSHQAFLFGYSSLMVDMKQLHPSPSQMFILWEFFKDNIDPVVKMLHRPTTRSLLAKAASNVDSISRAAEALLFALFYSAVVSMSDEQCQSFLDATKDTLMRRYRFATEQALARAGFLNSSSLMLLQAFVLFVVCVRFDDDSRLAWSLGGLAMHQAQALGIHRDGTNFKLSPFDTEMRRRLWWHISVLDNRAAEDHGTEPTFTEHFYDTKWPLNINDDDITPEMKEPPEERQGTTEMTFCLIRFELGVAMRKLNSNPERGNPLDREEMTIEEKESFIDDTHRMIENKYMQYCDMSVPIFWVSATVGRMILAKMWLMSHHPQLASRVPGVTSPSQHTRDRVFVTSIEVMEFSHLLLSGEYTAKWGWLFKTYMQWNSVAFVLSELCTRPPGPDVDRAWRALEAVYDERGSARPGNQKAVLWKPMRQLLERARAHRAQQSATTAVAKSATAADARHQHGDPFETGYPFNTVLTSVAEALGMDLNDFPIANSAATSSMTQDALQTPTDLPFVNTMAGDPLLQPDEDFWSAPGWSPGVGDFTMGWPQPNTYS